MRKRKIVAVMLALSLAFPTGGITAKAQDLAQTDKIRVKNPTEEISEDLKENSVEIQGTKKGLTGKAVPLGSDTISYEEFYTRCIQMPCEELGGIYFLNDKTLTFYSVKDNQTIEVEVFEEMYDCYVTDNKIYYINVQGEVQVYDLLRRTTEMLFESQNHVGPIGVDAKGRIYLAVSGENTTIYLYSPTGELLSQTISEKSIYRFAGFDDSTGNFYVEGYANYRSWGFDHDMRALRAGNVSGDTITFSENIMEYICQSYFYERQNQVTMQSDNYLFVDSTARDSLDVWNSDTYNPTETQDTVIFSLPRDNAETGEFDNLASVGVRAVYREKTDSVIVFEDNSCIAEYDLATGKKKSSTQTDYPVFSLMEYGEGIVAIEKNGLEYYYEYFPWKAATEIWIEGSQNTLQVGFDTSLVLKTNGSQDEEITWTSSNPRIVSVNQDGKVFAWGEGTATIRAITKDGLSAEYKMTVTKPEGLAKGKVISTTGVSGSNYSANNYMIWSAPMSSYFMENQDGTLTRVEEHNNAVLLETYSLDGKLVKTATLPKELNNFVGFYSGQDYNYVAFGQENPDENDAVEVLRIVKYSKNNQRLGGASIKGANTYYPVDAGSLRMTETAGKLYIHTCHTMYDRGDGLNHQGNMTFVLNQTDMTVEDSFYDVLNLPQAGYVGHSFNQFVQTDGEYLYRVDHGDAYPRGIALTKCAIGDDITDVSYTIPMTFSGEIGENYTGASIGGFELSKNNCVIAGNAIDFEVENSNKRNIFVTITDKNLTETRTIWLTDYSEKENLDVFTPHLVKVGADQFLVMWEEKNGNTVSTRMVTLDDSGNMTSDVVRVKMPLSDCEPIVCKDKMVRWYTTNNSAPIICVVNPFNLAFEENVQMQRFTDVTDGAWYAGAVNYVSSNGLMTGLNSTTFGPAQNIVRAQFAVIIHRMQDTPIVPFDGKFPDVKGGEWYSDAISWASHPDVGIVTGYDHTGYFGTADNITREQMAVMMWRYAKYLGEDVASEMKDFSGFSDAGKVSDFAKEAMQWAVGTGMITGTAGGTRLNPQGYANRAECATIIMRFHQKYVQ